MKSRAIYAFHILLIVVAAWGVGYSQAKGQEQAPPAPQSPHALVSGFTYQGLLKQTGSAVNSACDFKFGLWIEQSLGTQVGITQTLTSQSVVNGLFSVKLNGGSEFGVAPFDGNSRWLATAVRCPAGSGSYRSLTPQELNAVPYALFSKDSATAVNFSGSLSGDVTGGQGSTMVTSLRGQAVSPAAPVTGQMLKYTGSQWAPGGYQGLVIVARSGGNFSSIQAALNSISTASDTNRYLVKVMPGVYTETVTMKQYIDIEGSGELTTRITSIGNVAAFGTLRGANNAELRSLTVESTGGGANYAVAISNYSTSPRLTHITATASGANDNLGVYNNASSPVMSNVTASASGGTNCHGVYNDSSSPVMMNVTASAAGGTYTRGVYNSASSPMMTNVNASAAGGTTLNIGIDITASSSPTMTNVIARASGGTSSYGVYNYNSSGVMTNVIASATGATNDNYGVNNNISSPLMVNVTASAAGGTNSYGVYNSYSSPVIQNSSLRASGATNNYGVYNYAFVISGFLVRINNSQVLGSSNTINNASGITTRVGATLLDGGAVSNSGTLTCVGVYSGLYVALNSTCQ